MSVALFSLPRELVDEILSYVSKRDFRRFSRCSRACRDFIIPLVFNRIEWRTPSRATAFRDGGIVGHLRPVVHHISMHIPGRSNELLRNIDAFMVYMDVLALFPNITSLWMNLSTIAELEPNLIQVIFTKLSTSPAFHTLKSLNFTCKRFASFSLHDLAGARNQDYYAALPEKYYEYLGPQIRSGHNVDPPPGPPGLTELIVVTNQFLLTPTRRAEPHMSFLHQSCAKTLTRLRIRSDAMFVAPDPKFDVSEHNFDWQGLKQLQLELGHTDLLILPEIRDRFRNIEDLVILKHGAWYGANQWLPDGEVTVPRETMLCNAFQGMKNLKRLRLPWPTNNSGGDLFHNESHISPEGLEKAINCWIRGGAEKLEKVVFAKDYPGNKQDQLLQSLVGFKIVKDSYRSASKGELWWRVEPELGEVLCFYIQGVGQRSMDELFQVPPDNPPVNLYGKQNWFS
ncbi:hypothetical protein EYR41_008438 [Orbilia oligospora]|nr:hypothetical protein TWF751_001544 [Orbilia oligospora]TGJ66838.1 hypothetical protein EYR41_008438 [Orbilia oligospora]